MLPNTKQVAIVGVGTSVFGRQRSETPLSMAAVALRGALADAGLNSSDVDGLFTNVGSPLAVDYDRMAEAFGLNIRSTVQTWSHGRFVGTAVQSAVSALALGQCQVALCVGAVSFSGRGMVGGPVDHEGGRQGGGSHGELPHYGMTAPGAGAAMAFRRYCSRYGYDESLLSAVSVALRANAQHNPAAQMRSDLDSKLYSEQPYIVEPLRRPDFSLLSDGAAALVLTSSERAVDLQRTPIFVAGMQGIRAGRNEFIFAPPGLGVFTQTDSRSAPEWEVYEMAGMAGPHEVDCLQTYDAFSPNVIFVLERFGFVAEGAGLGWVNENSLRHDGKLPTNTSGGLLSEAHIAGWNHMVESVRQLRGEAGPRQVDNCQTVQWATVFGDSIIFSKELI